MRRTIITGMLAAAAIVATAGTASAAPTPIARPGTVAYEVDNGTTWTLADFAPFGRVTSSGPEKGYADAGVVVDLGPASQFTGVHIAGSSSLAENVWIADGSEATVPGTHLLSATVDFDYGLGGPTGWYMTGKHDGYSGQTLTAAQIRADFAGDEVWAWVGIANAGTNGYGLVASVNGHLIDAIAGVEAHDGTVTAYVTRFAG